MYNVTGVRIGDSETNANNLIVMTTPAAEPDCTEVDSPGGTPYYIPRCGPSIKPKVGQRFPSFQTAIDFYIEYAKTVGFDTRRCTAKRNRKGEVHVRYVLCHRAGFTNREDGVAKPTKEDGEPKKHNTKRRLSNRVGCKAKVMLKAKN